MVGNIRKTLVQCENEGLKPQFIEFEQVESGKSVTLDIQKGTFSKVSLQCDTTVTIKVSGLLYM